MSFSADANRIYRYCHKLYRNYIRKHLSNALHAQRFKLLWFGWGYFSLLSVKGWSWNESLSLILNFIKIDWNVLHGHKPSEIAIIGKAMADLGPASNDEVFVEAGCWLGGSSAKFSLLCAKYGYQLHIYDSFEGVENLSAEERTSGYDFSGQYVGPIETVVQNMKTYGRVEICHFHKGWFSDTIAQHPVPHPVKIAYIDCDLAKGTSEVLQGVAPNLSAKAVIFSQDYHIKSVRELLHNPMTWERLGKPMPTIRYQIQNMAAIRFG